ncbi:hypothetical protein Scep_029903 [Stephania cephalantha]|uniref:Uncharacterized protein n=1 Tax=Stephania cephalantha TaxID=152367 RepID=A0AAP0E329_9MAGN
MKWRRKSLMANSKKLMKAVQDKLGTYHEERGGHTSRIKELEMQLRETQKSEEEYWKMRSHIEWLKSGDRNTTFFHSVIKGMRRRNTILGLRKREGRVVFEKAEILGLAKSFFGASLVPKEGRRLL